MISTLTGLSSARERLSIAVGELFTETSFEVLAGFSLSPYHPSARITFRHDLKEIPMTSRLNPYLSFRDNAREAMEFYQSVFGGTLNMNTFGEFGMPDTPQADLIMHAQLETDRGYTVMAADTPPEMEHKPGSNISISLSGDDGDDLRGYWEKLSDGGTVAVPLEKQAWGDEFGMCVDRFGISWMVNIGQPQQA
jgi:PhnB protein